MPWRLRQRLTRPAHDNQWRECGYRTTSVLRESYCKSPTACCNLRAENSTHLVPSRTCKLKFERGTRNFSPRLNRVAGHASVWVDEAAAQRHIDTLVGRLLILVGSAMRRALGIILAR
jgi:hypothetical protein